MSRGPQGNGYAPVLGPRQPHVQWDFQAQAELRGAVAVGGDGTAYFGDLSRNLYALGADHQVRWSHAAAGRILVTPAILRDGLIIFADMDGGIYGLNPEGTVVWTSKVGASPAAPVVWNGKILIQSRTGKYCLDGNTGSIVWQGAGGSGNPFSPVIADGIMLVSDGAQLQALDASTGQIRWSADLSDEVAQSPALDANGLAYIATRDSVLHCLDRQGHERWQYRSQAHITTSPAVHSSGGILFGSADRSVSLVREGELRWKFPTGSICSDPVTARDGAVYFGCQDGALYGVNSAGQQEWKRDLTGEIRGSAIALSQDGALFVSTINRRLFRIAD